MSFEPTLIIDFDDLDGYESSISLEAMSIRPDSKKEKDIRRAAALEEVWKYFKMKPIDFKGHKIIIVRPELTKHNAEVRRVLDERNIYYKIDP